MSIPYFRYDAETGRIHDTGSVAESMAWGMLAAQGSGVRVVLGQSADAQTQYCVDEELRDRAPIDCHWSGLTLTGIPRCTVIIDGTRVEAEGSLVLEEPPRRRVIIDEPRFLRAEWLYYKGAMQPVNDIARMISAGDE